MTRHSIIFSGHMIDDPARRTPRFPAKKEAAAIRAVNGVIQGIRQPVRWLSHGFAGGACGGDIIFHEICLQNNIPSTLFLALEPEAFINKSVRFAGEGWVTRFERLCQTLPVLLLPEKSADDTLSVWERTNEWILASALAYSRNPCTLVAIWDGKGGDGPGGTKHMVDEIRSLNQKKFVIDPGDLPAEKE